jgi:hypothetical protein
MFSLKVASIGFSYGRYSKTVSARMKGKEAGGDEDKEAIENNGSKVSGFAWGGNSSGALGVVKTCCGKMKGKRKSVEEESEDWRGDDVEDGENGIFCALCTLSIQESS